MILNSFIYAIILLLIVSRSKVLERKDDYIKLQLLPNKMAYPFYEVQLYLGDPKQPQTYLIDTGSNDFITKIAGCNGCLDISTRPLFKPIDSHTFNPINCSQDQIICHQYCRNRVKKENRCFMSQEYGNEQTSVKLKAQLVKELVSFTSDQSEEGIEGLIGAIQSVNNKRIMSNGILGLSGVQKRRSFIYEWFQGNNIPQQHMNIGICISQNYGIMQWGAIQQKRDDHILISLDQKFVTYNIEYSFDDLNFLMEGKQNYVMMDSGSPFLLIYTEIHQALMVLMSNICIKQSAVCLQVPNQNDYSNIQKFLPSCFILQASSYFEDVSLLLDTIFTQITIKIQGKSFSIKPSNYFQEVEVKQDLEGLKSVCMVVMPTNQDHLILGLPFFKGRKIIYNYNYDVFKTKIYEEYDCSVRKVQAESLYNYYFWFLGVFLFVFVRNFIFNTVRKCCKKKEEEQQIQSQSKLQNEDKTNDLA